MLTSKQLRPVATLMIAALLTGACATGPRDSEGRPRTALDRSIGQCAVSIIGGALVGALLGAATRRGGAGTGAAIGAGVGTVACVIILAVNNEEDRERIRQAQQRAYQAGRSATVQYVGQDGAPRFIKTSVEQLSIQPQASTGDPNETFVGPCRRAQTSITVGNKGTVALDSEVVCRTSMGDYLPYTQKTVS